MDGHLDRDRYRRRRRRTLAVLGLGLGLAALAASVVFSSSYLHLRSPGQAASQPTEAPPGVPPVVVSPPQPTEAAGDNAGGFFDDGRTDVPQPSTPVPFEPAQIEPAPPEPAATQSPPPVLPEVDAALVQTVVSAYLRYWTVRLNATDNPYTPVLDFESVMAGDELGAAYAALQIYQADAPVPQHTELQHSLVLRGLEPALALLEDHYTASRQLLDPTTGEALGEPIVESFTDLFVLEPIDGVWKVTLHVPEDTP